MAWSMIRKATREDQERLAQAAMRFAIRHNLRDWGDDDTPEQRIDAAISHSDSASEIEVIECRRLERLWLACTRRALRHPSTDGIAWGYVGYSVD